jgi:hypothetical protein
MKWLKRTLREESGMKARSIAVIRKRLLVRCIVR